METVDKLLRELAQSLGTTVEYLWAVLVKQQIIDAQIMLAISSIILVFNILLSMFYKYIANRFSGIRGHYDECSPRQTSWNVYFAILGVSIIAIIILWIYAYKIYANPEYYALQEILNVLGGKQ